MKSTVAQTPVAVPLHERKWVDVNPGSYDHECYVITKAMTRLLRHDQNIPWETDGAVKYEDIVEFFNKKKRKKFEGAPQWSLNDWISFLAKGGGAKKRFQYCLNPNSYRHISYFRAIQGHSGALLLILSCKTKTCYRKDLPSTSTTSGTSVKCIQELEVVEPRRTKSQTRKKIRVLHNGEPDGR